MMASCKPRFNDSPCSKNILKVKEFCMAGRKIFLNSGNLMSGLIPGIMLGPFVINFLSFLIYVKIEIVILSS